MRLKYLQHLTYVVVTTALMSCISLVGGLGIEAVQDKLLPLVPLIVALPALNNVVGDYAAIIAAHVTDPITTRRTLRYLAGAISKAIWVNIIGILALSLIIAWHRGYIFTGIFLFKFLLFTVIAIAGVIAMMFFITLGLNKLLKHNNLSTDDVLIVIVTTITDVMMLTLVALAAVFLF